MHVQGYPHFYVKGDRRRAVYFTAEARDLVAQGWKREQAKQPELVAAPVAPAPEVKAGPVDEPEVETDSTPAFELMTRPELLEYAASKGVDLPNNALKADLIKACQEIG